jgi:hypothetical protein
LQQPVEAAPAPAARFLKRFDERELRSSFALDSQSPLEKSSLKKLANRQRLERIVPHHSSTLRVS